MRRDVHVPITQDPCTWSRTRSPAAPFSRLLHRYDGEPSDTSEELQHLSRAYGAPPLDATALPERIGKKPKVVAVGLDKDRKTVGNSEEEIRPGQKLGQGQPGEQAQQDARRSVFGHGQIAVLPDVALEEGLLLYRSDPSTL